MKKNLLTLITFALVLVNLVLTAVMALQVVPEVNKVNTLISKISEAIDLDIASGNEHSGGASYDVSQIAVYDIPDNITVNLKQGEDGQNHFAVMAITLSLNINSNKYTEYNADTLPQFVGVMKSEINNIVGSYTYEAMRGDQQGVLDEIKTSLNKVFGGDLITSVGFSTINYQ